MLAELDSAFRSYALQALIASELVPEKILETLDPDVADKVREAYHGLIIEEVSPGKWGRR